LRAQVERDQLHDIRLIIHDENFGAHDVTVRQSTHSDNDEAVNAM
jgi:hypothetical protein